ncbi:MAG: lipopolysaccharide biosynthesis protein [Hyphomicrobiales bacterium]|nr:lipopolysaccharide biosynthesis protein [Hyphomicrobiales bacterium]MBV8662721.1 lipopolysaccharide biosynthesis protein [Hyphomicrobiales bacterium]
MSGDGMGEGDASIGKIETIDFIRLSRTLLRRKRWILGPTFVCFALALVFVFVVSPHYTGVAKVLLENQESYFTRPDKAVADPATNFDDEGVQSQAETVATTELARQAVVKLDLADRDEFNPKSSANPLSLILSLFNGRPGPDRLVDAFLSRLTVFPVPKSRVLQIEFVSADPAFAARGANAVADLYLTQQEEAKRNEAKSASSWLSQKIEELRGKTADAEAKLEAFRATSGLFAGANGLNAPAQQLADLNTQLSAARARQADAAAKAKALRALLHDERLDEIPGVAQDESLRRFFEQRVALKAQIALESRTLLPQHPRMKELAGELAGLDAEIRLAANKVVIALENDAKVAAAEVDSLTGVLAAQSKTVATNNVDEAKLRELDLEATTTRQQLESYMGKYREALAREADNAAPADARIIASATEPRTPTFPKKGPTVLLATLAGFLISLGVVAAHTLVTDAGGEEEAVAEQAAAAAPPEPEDEPPPPARQPRATEVAAEAVDRPAPAEAPDRYASPEAVVDRLAGAAPSEGVRTTLFAGERTGRTLALALSAARALSKRGRTALVDLGVSQDWLADVVDHEGEGEARFTGLAELLDGRAALEDVIHRDLSAPLDIVPAGAGTIELDGLGEALAALASSYQFVVLHASDWRAPEVAAALEAVSSFVIVAPSARLDRALNRLRAELAETSIATMALASDHSGRIVRAA